MTENDILNFLESKELYSFLLPWKILFIIITILFLFAIYYYIAKAGFLIKDNKERIGNFLNFQKNKVEKSFINRSKTISSLLNKKHYKRAILMMEELFIDVFNSLDIKGENLLEMINNSPVSDMGEVKKLYIISEEIKTGHGYIANMEELEKLFNSCEEALRKLKIIT